ncbi:hypothetical protein [Leeia aquatica]|uniref:Uncharacterized protein n=1 Tax=Leeia aquatica TaxID=2725557 RepID=A0A847S9K2_9NEIS|nr:hypothetical protein [Leeia aquatica]NLR76433.1 hypothetical protein [Leeia aquatica]
MLFPDRFSTPRTGQEGPYQFRLLCPADVTADHKAVMAAAERIRGVFGPDNHWPPATLTEADNLADLQRHEQDSLNRLNFAYSIWQDEHYAGCAYIKPFKSRLEIDARRGRFRELCYLWVSNDFVTQEEAIYQHTRHWINQHFPLRQPAWPGREWGWAQWAALASA